MLDILAIGAHPDDIEIFMGGSIAAFEALGLITGILNLTRGEAGTYGSPEIRAIESKRAAEILSVNTKITLDLPDGNLRNTEVARKRVVDVIRKTRPKLVFSFADFPMRHPDHRVAGEIARDCVFLSGLEKLDTGHPPFRPAACIGFPELILPAKPDFVVDISNVIEIKQLAIRAYESQVTAEGEDDEDTKTFIRSKRFWEILTARDTMVGAGAGVRYGEAFFCNRPPLVGNVVDAFVHGKAGRGNP